MSKKNTQAHDNNYKTTNPEFVVVLSDGWVPSYPSLSIKIDNTLHIKNQSF